MSVLTATFVSLGVSSILLPIAPPNIISTTTTTSKKYLSQNASQDLPSSDQLDLSFSNDKNVPMTNPKLINIKKRVSQEYIAIQTDGAPPPNAVEVLEDAGRVFAVVPASSLSEAQISEALPVLSVPGSALFEVPTGALVVRWDGSADDVRSSLSSVGMEIIRDYGSGGIVMSTEKADPFDLAERVADLDFIRSATIHTIRRSERR